MSEFKRPWERPEDNERTVRVTGAQDISGEELPQANGFGTGFGLPAGMPERTERPNMERVETMTGARKVGEDQIRKATELLRKYKAGKASVERRIIAAQQWWKLRNWQEIEKAGAMGSNPVTKTSTGWLWNAIVGKHADFIDAFPEPVILPRAEDDTEEAKRLSEVIPCIMQANDFEETYSEVCWQKLQEGTGAYGVFWDASKQNGLGDITIQKINLLNLFWEPGIDDLQDSRNVFLVSLEDVEELERRYPEQREKLRDNGNDLSKYKYDDNVDVTGKAMVVDWYYKVSDGGRTMLHYVKFCGNCVLYASEDDPDCTDGWYMDGRYPIVLDALYPVEGSPTGYGLIDVAAGTQKDIDLLSQAIVSNTTMSATPRFFVRKDGAINMDQYADWTQPFVTVNSNLGADSVSQININPVSGNVINVLTQKIEELKFVTGNSDVNNGSTPSGVTAASAIAALKEDAGRTSKDSNKSMYRAYRKIITMVIERVRQFYDLPRQFRIIGPRGERRFVSYTNQGLQPQPLGMLPGDTEMSYRLPVLDIDVRAQREDAYTKMAQNELALQFYQQGFFNPNMTDQALMALDMMEFKGRE